MCRGILSAAGDVVRDFETYLTQMAAISESKRFSHRNGYQGNVSPNITESVPENGSIQRIYDNHADDVNDPMYELFLSHLHQDGKSYILRMPDYINGELTYVNYEDDDVPRVSQLNILKENTSNASMSNLESENRVRFSDVDKYCGIKNEQGIKFQDIEGCYKTFLEKVTLKNNRMFLEWKLGVTINYEMDDMMNSFERNDTKSTTNGQHRPDSPFKVIEDDGMNFSHHVEDQCEGHMNGQSKPYDQANENASTSFLPWGFTTSVEYKEALFEVLRKPFSQNEFDELFKKATERKPITKEKHLRKMSISYDTDTIGQSYLDYYPDLASQIHIAHPKRGLTLLRGLFFWLQHLCHQGSFPPWQSSTASAPILVTDCEEIPSTDVDLHS